MSYKSENLFRLWAYTVSHSTLLLRSEMSIDEIGNLSGKDNTIDIEFWDVSYINIPSDLHGIYLKEISSDIPDRLKEHTEYNRKIFEFISANKSFYVIAGGCIIGKSKWINENRLLNPYLEYTQILQSW